MNPPYQTTSVQRAMKYFIEDPSYPDFYKCLICDENKKTKTPSRLLCGKRKWNLKRHIESSHQDIQDTFFSPKKKTVLSYEAAQDYPESHGNCYHKWQKFSFVTGHWFQSINSRRSQHFERCWFGDYLESKFLWNQTRSKHQTRSVRGQENNSRQTSRPSCWSNVGHC